MVGVHPNTATRTSIFLEYLIATVCMVLGLIHLITGASDLTAELAHVFWLAPLVLVDALMRSNCVEDERARQYGFYEGLVRWLLRRP